MKKQGNVKWMNKQSLLTLTTWYTFVCVSCSVTAGPTGTMWLMATRGRRLAGSPSSWSRRTWPGSTITTWTWSPTPTWGTPGSPSSGSTASSAGWGGTRRRASRTTAPAPVSTTLEILFHASPQTLIVVTHWIGFTSYEQVSVPHRERISAPPLRPRH